MGTRYFNAIEEKNSRIKWEQADDLMRVKFSSAIKKYSYGIVSAKVARILVFFPAIVLIILTIGLINALRAIPLIWNPELIFFVLYGISIIFFSIFFLKRYLKFRPYLYPEKQPSIWFFRTKCMGVSYYNAMNDNYFAYFNKGGGHISITITAYECKNKLPIGKEYIFYKFNNQSGNRWAAIEASKLNEF